jgi:polysaccharide biosynthesis transport protein
MRDERSLQVVPLQSETIRVPAPAPGADMEPENGGLNLGQYLWIIKRHRWKILPFVLGAVLTTLLISKRITPIYESTAMVDIDRQTPTGVIGQESVRTTINDSDQFIATQIKLIQSDSVLRPVVQKLKLRELEKDLELPSGNGVASKDAPIVLKRLKVARPPSTYILLISYRSSDPHLAASVANAVAQSYLEHTYNLRYRSSASVSAFMERQLEELRAKVENSSAALLRFERELNVVNPEEKTTMISARLLQLNSELTNAQADRLKKEAANQSIRNGSPEAALVSAQGETLRRLLDRMDEVQQKFADVKVYYGPNHPEYKRLAGQVAELERQIGVTRQNIAKRVGVEFEEALSREAKLAQAVQEQKAEFDRINSRSVEYQALKREAEADKKLYEELVRKIKEASINSSFQNSSVRIADAARPTTLPVSPNVKLNLTLAFVFSLLLAIVAAVLSEMLDNTVRDPEQVMRSLNAEVVGSLPSVRNWRGAKAKLSAGSATTAMVRYEDGAEQMLSGYGEAIRTLRNSILLTDFDRRIRSILVTSATPGEGKSTTAAHLAIAHAENGQRTLIIDGDLRKPSVAKRFGIPAPKGLSTVLLGEASWRDVIVKLDAHPNLHILPAGPPSRRASDLIGRGLEELLEEAGREYDLVILDGPPLPGFAEPLQMATAVDGVIVVTRAGQTSRKAVGGVLSTLHRLRANVLGLVLNEVNKEMSDSYHYYGHYGKYYQNKKTA